MMAEHLIDEAVFGDHPLGRPVLGTDRAHPRHLHPRRDRRLPRPPLVAGARRRVRGRQPRRAADERRSSTSCSSASRSRPEPEPYEPAPRARAARAGARARLQPVAPADVLPPGGRRHRPAPARRAVDLLDAARRLDGLAAVRRDPRAARARLLGHAPPPRLRRRAACCSCPPGWSRASASRPTGGCARSSPSCASDGPTEAEVERARAYAAGARAIAFENTGAVARYAAQQTIVYGEDVDPDAAIALLDAVTVRRGAGGRGRGRRRAVGGRASGRTRVEELECRLRPPARRRRAGARSRRCRAGSRRQHRRSSGRRRPRRDRELRRRRRRIGAHDHDELASARATAGAARDGAARRAPSSIPGRAGAAGGHACWARPGRNSGGAGLRPHRRRRCSRCAPTSGGRRPRSRSSTRRWRCCDELGPDARLHTTVLGTGHLGPAASGTATCTCAAAATRRSATARSTASGSTATARPPPARRAARGAASGASPAAVIADESLFDRPARRPDERLRRRHPRLRRPAQRADLRPRRDARARSPAGAFAARELALTMRAAQIRRQAPPRGRRPPPPARARSRRSPRRRCR